MEPRKMAVCQECLSLLRLPHRTARRIARPLSIPDRTQSFSFTRQSHTTARTSQRPSLRTQPRAPACRIGPQQTQRRYAATNARAATQSLDLNAIHDRVNDLATSAVKVEDGSLPTEQRVLYVFEQLQSIAASLLDERSSQDKTLGKEQEQRQRPATTENTRHETATSALLGSVNARGRPTSISKDSILNLISQEAEKIVQHPDVFITPAILKLYIELQSLLQQPQSFPDVFDLYAQKPVPKLKSNNEVHYEPASPDKINAAIDSKTANLALTAAIEAHNLPLAIDAITTSFCTPAFKKAKIFRQAALPISGAVVAPMAAYTLATSFSSLQQTMDPAMATQIAFAGIMTYAGAVGMVGYVAVTTANDQMDRVTWASGVPLWERWIREEERAAVDRLAGAWGFKEMDKRGEEEGEEWEALREWIGVRGMMLDRVSLMEGME